MTMEETFKKFFYASMGIISLGKKKIEELAKDLSEKTNLSEEEGRKLAEELNAESEKFRGEFQESVKNIVKETMKRLNIPSREEVEELKERIRILEEKLADNSSSPQL